MSFGCSPSDVLKLLEFSTRVYLAFKDANENSEAQVEILVREFTTFHSCLIQLAELMKEYGKPMPFPCKEFELTLEKCVKALQPYSDHLVDRKMGVKKFYYTIRYMGMEKEIDNLRKQITGHYQALNMCISFLQLRLHLEATKQTQRLLDVAPPRAISVRGRAYSAQALTTSSKATPLAIEAPDEHPLYQEWKIFDRWLQSEDERAAQEAVTARPRSFGDTPSTGPNDDAEKAFVLYQLRQQVDDLILLEENHSKRAAAAEQRTHLSPSDAMKREVRDTLRNTNTAPRPIPRTYTLDTEHSFDFSGFNDRCMGNSSATLRAKSSTPSPTASPTGSPRANFSFFGAIDEAKSPTDSVMDRDFRRQSSVSTNRSSFNGSLDSRSSIHGLGVSTAGTTPDDSAMHNLRRKPSAGSLITLRLGEGALDWKALSHKVQVERTRQERIQGCDQKITENKVCDIHWQYRRDTGISIRAVYRSTKDSKSRPWATQHFPAIGPSIPLTTTFADGEVSVDFPRGSFGRLDRNLTDIKYTFPKVEAAEKFQTLLYTNDGADPAELKFDRPILTISSNKNPTECRGRNLRLWARTETHLEEDGPVIYDVLVLLFFTSALEDNGHWVEEPHCAFEWLTESACKKESDKLILTFSKNASKWTSDKLFRRRKSSTKDDSSEPSPPTGASIFSITRNNSFELPESARSVAGASRSSSIISIKSAQSRFGQRNGASMAGGLNRYGYSELEIKFQSKRDRKDFIEIWQAYVKPLGKRT